MAGALFTKVLLVPRHMGISIYSACTYFVHQSKFLFPDILAQWELYRTLEGSTPWDTWRNMEHTHCSVLQLLKFSFLSG